MSKNTNISELINYLSYDGSGNIVFNTVSAATTNTDKFLVSDAGVLKFRTAAQLLSDIGAQASGSYQAALSGTGFVKISGTTISYDNSTYATQTYVGTAVSNLVGAAPSTLDTLNELATALGNDANFATTIATSIGTKQPQLNGTGFVKISGTTVSYDNSTYLTTGTASSTYVPYTGASTDLVLGANNFSSKRVSVLKSSDGYGGFTSNYLFLQTGSSTTNVGTDGISLFSKPNQRALSINYDISGTNYAATLDANLLTASRTFEFPNASGVLALTSNIPTVSGVYLPLAGGTLTGPLNGTSASFSGNVTLTSGYIEMPWASDTRTIWERYFSSTYFQRISSNGTLRQLRLESNGAYGNASIVLDGQSNTTVTATITSDKFVATGAATFNGNVTTSGVSTLQSAVRINNGTGGTSPILTFGTENESFQGFKGIYLEGYWMYTQVHYNEGLRIRAVNGAGGSQTIATFSGASGNFSTLGSITAGSTITAVGNISARNFNKYVRSWSSNGSYVWSEQFDAIASSFDNAGWYKGFIREANGAHYRGFYFDILVGQKGYGSLSAQYRVFNIVSADSPYVGGCGSSAFASIDNNGFTKQANPCGDDLLLYITKLGG